MNQYWECINVEILNQQTETDTEWGKKWKTKYWWNEKEKNSFINGWLHYEWVGRESRRMKECFLITRIFFFFRWQMIVFSLSKYYNPIRFDSIRFDPIIYRLDEQILFVCLFVVTTVITVLNDFILLIM